MQDRNGFFEIPRIGCDIPFGDFYRDYFEPEQPVVIEGAGRDWPALKKWSRTYLQDRLAGEPSVRHIGLFLLLDRDVMAEDFDSPWFVEGLNDPARIFPYRSSARIWINSRDNVSVWHFDNGVVNNFNTQIVGRKEWILVSPQTPPDCYPFSNFVILEEDDKVLSGRVFTRFVTNPGDMLYLPPLWYHKVRALEEENINLMWVFTKRSTSVSSPALDRDLYRYRMHRSLSSHRLGVVRALYAKILSCLPGYLKIAWHFDQLIETDMPYSHRGAVRWLARELGMLGRTVLTLPRIRRQIGEAERAPRPAPASGRAP